MSLCVLEESPVKAQRSVWGKSPGLSSLSVQRSCKFAHALAVCARVCLHVFVCVRVSAVTPASPATLQWEIPGSVFTLHCAFSHLDSPA